MHAKRELLASQMSSALNDNAVGLQALTDTAAESSEKASIAIRRYQFERTMIVISALVIAAMLYVVDNYVTWKSEEVVKASPITVNSERLAQERQRLQVPVAPAAAGPYSDEELLRLLTQ